MNRFPAPVTAALLAGLLTQGCATHGPNSIGTRSAATPIPERPEMLEFAPLDYEPPDPSTFRVELASGPVAYVASDRELPLVNLSILVRTGNYLDPAGREGLGVLTGYLLSKGGTESMTAEEFEERIAFLAAELESGVGDTEGTVSLNLLSKDLDEGLAILREVLVSPRFQEDKIALRKEQLLQAIKERNDDSRNIEARERDFLAFGDSFWINQYETESSITAITRQDLQAYHQRWFHPDNFVVAASGDFDRNEMIGKLEGLFADWPFKGERPTAIPTNTVFAAPGVYLVDKDVNQGRVSVMLPGVMRTDPDYFAISLMNQILGASGFTSRLVNRVRSDEGLAYSTYSRLQGGTYFPPPFLAGLQTKSRTVAYAISIVLEEMARMAAEPVSEEELDTVKRSLIDTFPRAFASKSATMGRFASDEFTGRYAQEPDYYVVYRDRVAAVTREDVQRVAQKHLQKQPPTILVVGDAEEILKGHPDHPNHLEDFTDGDIINVPLRDPMTMVPMND